jgi:Helix-turn-helix domain/SnoaL-like domain
VLQTRIERAKHLITTPQRLNLAEIGLQVGFYDHAHFTKAFKQIVGETPRQFFGCRVSEQEFTSIRDRAIVSLWIVHIQSAIEHIDTLNRFVLSVDSRDRNTMRDCLTDEVDLDYSALDTFMPPMADELVKKVLQDRNKFKAVQHMTANHQVTIDSL